MINNRSTTGCDAATLMEGAKCYDCLSDKEKLSIVLKTLAAYAVDLGVDVSLSDLLHDSKCLECSDPGMIKSIILEQLCAFFVALES